MTRLEQAIHWRPRPDLPLNERVYRFAEGMLVLLHQLGQRGKLAFERFEKGLIPVHEFQQGGLRVARRVLTGIPV